MTYEANSRVFFGWGIKVDVVVVRTMDGRGEMMIRPSRCIHRFI